MNGLSLFSGAGIGELVFKHILPDYRTVGYVEWDKYCQEVIRARIKDGILDDAPIFGDIRQFNERYASSYVGKVDWLSGGFPCQPFSVAGNRLGEADERNMWPETRDAICILRPNYVFLENVPGLFAQGYATTVIADLAANGYDAEWDIVPAAFVGAKHLRRRWWVLAHNTLPNEQEGLLGPGEKWKAQGQHRRLRGDKGGVTTKRWPAEPKPRMVRVVHGMAKQLDARHEALGNGWVPQVVKAILRVEKLC